MSPALRGVREKILCMRLEVLDLEISRRSSFYNNLGARVFLRNGRPGGPHRRMALEQLAKGRVSKSLRFLRTNHDFLPKFKTHCNIFVPENVSSLTIAGWAGTP